MDRAEIVRELRAASLWLPLVPGTEIPERAAIEAAIALIEPEPVTEEGLRAEGFRQDRHGYWRMDMAQHGPRKLLSYKPGEGACFLLGWDSIDLHIESMQQLREVIKALRGKP